MPWNQTEITRHPVARRKFALRAIAAASLLGCFSVLTPQAQAQDDGWRFRASLYGYFPSISGNTDYRFGSSGINVNSDEIMPDLSGAFMGAFEANNGHWGVFTDLMYVDLSESKSGIRNFTLDGPFAVPGTAALDANLGIKSWLWTIAGTYRVYQTPVASIDLLGGARMNEIKNKLGYAFNLDLGPFSGPLRSGELSELLRNWDGIIGLKGRYAFGSGQNWYVVGYGDIGTGESDFTWQAMAGLGYSFAHRWDVTAAWRHIGYELSSGSIQDLNYDGPLIGLSYNF